MGVLAGDVTCPTTPASSTKKVRVAIYATFSTSKQDPRSIEDQVARCEARLKELGILDAEITVLADEGISGELMSRPGVDELKDLLRLRHAPRVKGPAVLYTLTFPGVKGYCQICRRSPAVGLGERRL